MKKYSWIMALLLALTLGFIGCPTDDNGGNPPPPPPPFTSDLVDARGTDGSWVVTLAQTQYSEGVQVQMDYATLMQGYKVTEGDEYTLELEFTVDRVPATNILIFLVDNTEAPSYWRKLTNTVEIDKDELEAGVPYEITLKMTASGTASSAAVDANKLCIETQEGKRDTVTVADLTMTFTKFLFSRGEGAEPPVIEKYVPNPVEEDEDYTVKLEGLIMKNAEAFPATYQNLWLDLSEAFPEDFDIMNYDKFTLKAKFYDEAGEEIAAANSLGQTRWSFGNAYSGGEFLTPNLSNLGTAATVEVGIFDNELLVTPTMLYVQNAGETVAFIEITEITFHWGTDRLVSVSAPEPLPVASIEGFTLVSSLTLDISNFNNTKWDWTATDQGAGYLKGRINTTTATAIKALVGGKYQIYWVSANGLDLGATEGIGSFGGQNYNANGNNRGIVEGNIDSLTLMTDGDAGKINLNTYGGGGVVKILFYEPEGGEPPEPGECECEGDADNCTCGEDCDCEVCEPGEGGGELEPLSVTFGAGMADTVVTASGGATITYIAGPPTGYTVTYNIGENVTNNDMGNVIARFKVDLGIASLEDFESVTLTYQGVSGDIAYKNIHLLAATAETDITGWKNDTLIMGMIVTVKDAEKQFHEFGEQVNGTTATEYTLNIVNPGDLSGEIWFAFYMAVNADDGDDDDPAATSFSISGVTFNPAD